PAGWSAHCGFKKQTRDTKERLAEEVAADAARDLVVDRGVGALAGFLPQETSRKGVGRGFPEAKPRRARQSLVNGSLVRMQELIGRELVIVDDPRAVQVVLQIRDG